MSQAAYRAAVSVEELRRLLDYDPLTGVFTWRVNRAGSARAGTVAGSLHADGYIRISLYDVLYRAHRLAWVWVTGEWPTFEVDHRDLVRNNNRWSNLRPASDSLQKANEPLRKSSKSGIKGVHFCNTCKKWMASIAFQKKKETIGRFATKDEAAAAYRRRASELFGEYARFE